MTVLNRKLAIMDFLSTRGFTSTLHAFQAESRLSIVDDGQQTYSGLLERKWTTIVRLQKKIMDLETRIEQLQKELAFAKPFKKLAFDPVTANTSSLNSSSGDVDAMNESVDQLLLPRFPEAHTLTGHRDVVTRLIFHPTLPTIASSSDDTSVRLWNYETGKYEQSVRGHSKSILGCAFDNDGRLLATCSADLTIKLWDMAELERRPASGEMSCLRTFYGHEHVVSGVVFLPGTDILISCSRDTTVRVWNVKTGYCLQVLRGHTSWVRAISVTSDGQFLASSSDDHVIMLWSTSKWTCLSQLRGHEHVIEAIAFAPEESLACVQNLVGSTKPLASRLGMNNVALLASASRDKTVKLWNAGTGECLYTFNGHENWVRGVSFFHGGQLLVSVSDDKTLRIWNLSDGYLVKTLSAHSHFVSCVDVHPYLPILATGSVDQSVKIWLCS